IAATDVDLAALAVQAEEVNAGHFLAGAVVVGIVGQHNPPDNGDGAENGLPELLVVFLFQDVSPDFTAGIHTIRIGLRQNRRQGIFLGDLVKLLGFALRRLGGGLLLGGLLRPLLGFALLLLVGLGDLLLGR